ncbi:hypothetical protein P154DRAFT_422063, partial [Amniculicola lignicola CBS 123094]
LSIWLHDYHSTHGTAVGQNGQNQKEVRRKETWLLAYPPSAPDGFEEMTIHCSSLAIRIEFPNHRTGAPDYPSTQAPSKAPTPRDRLVYYAVKHVGVGTFGKVMKIIKARDGKVLAAKIFNPPPNRNKRQRNDPDLGWLMNIRREFTLVRDNPHVSFSALIILPTA